MAKESHMQVTKIPRQEPPHDLAATALEVLVVATVAFEHEMNELRPVSFTDYARTRL
jgi:hypothetical protein